MRGTAVLRCGRRSLGHITNVNNDLDAIVEWFCHGPVQEGCAPRQCICPAMQFNFHLTEMLSNTLIHRLFFYHALRQKCLKPRRHFANVDSSRARHRGITAATGQEGTGSIIPIHARPTGRAILSGPCNGSPCDSGRGGIPPTKTPAGRPDEARTNMMGV